MIPYEPGGRGMKEGASPSRPVPALEDYPRPGVQDAS